MRLALILCALAPAVVLGAPSKQSVQLAEQTGEQIGHGATQADQSQKPIATSFQRELLEKVLMADSIKEDCSRLERMVFLPDIRCNERRDESGELSGIISIAGEKYEFFATRGMIEWASVDGSKEGSFDALSHLKTIASSEEIAAKCPWCLFVGGAIIGGQIACATSSALASYVCNSTCTCGVQSYETQCVLGYLEVRCRCYSCPEPPTPAPMPAPGGPGGTGPYFPGTPWDFTNHGPFIVGGNHWLDID